MRFLRKTKSGAADHDPRQKHWAIYYCDVCKDEKWIDISSNFVTFDYLRARKCSDCQSFGENDFINTKKLKIEKLKNDNERIISDIEKLTKEVEILESSINA